MNVVKFYKIHILKILLFRGVLMDKNKTGINFKETNCWNLEEYEYSKKFFENILKDYVDVKVPKNQNDHTMKKKINIVSQDLNELDITCFCNETGFSPTVLFMTASLLAMDKFTYSTDSLLINTYDGKNKDYELFKDSYKEFPLLVNRKNRDQNIKTLLEDVDNNWDFVLKHCHFPVEKMFKDKSITPTIAYGYFEGHGKEVRKTVFKNLKSNDYELQIDFVRTDNDFSAHLYYDCRVYTLDYMETLIYSIKTIIDKIINSNIEKTFIKDISLTDDMFKEEVHFEIPTLVELFERQVSKTPSKTALIVDGEEISYNLLNQNANRIANNLLKRINPGTGVVILLGRSKEFIYSIWGVLKAGCYFIPVDSSFQKGLIEYIIEDSNSQVIITDRDMDNAISPQELLDYNDINTLKPIIKEKEQSDNKFNSNNHIGSSNTNNPNINIDINDMAYMLYTSGTTGVPKGVLASHKNFSNFTMPSKDNILYNEFTEGIDRLLTITSVNFTPSLKDIAITLFSGGTLIYANNEEIGNIDSLSELIDKYNPQMIGSITPSRLIEFLNFPNFVKAFQNIKKITLLGEKFPPELYSKIKSINPSISIYNEYGSTETTAITLKKILSEEDITLGFPAHNTELYIMDIDEKVLPNGVQGVLYVSGPSITEGYSNKELNNAFINIENKRFFKTGDLGLLLNNGELQLFGRADRQIKLRGQRLEPDGITSLMNKFDGIINSAVIIKEINGLEDLIGYYVSDIQINEAELRNYLEDKLPIYMVPSIFMQIPEIPTNTNGKLDVKQLPEPNLSVGRYEDPRNEKEKLVVSAFEDLFKRKIGINDDYISLGGNSLSSMNIISYLSEYNIATVDLLQLRTPKKIAAKLKKRDIKLGKYGFEDSVPLSSSQLNVYLDELVNEMGTGYNNAFKVELTNKYSVEDIKNALFKLFERHPILKARIKREDEELPSCAFDAYVEIEERSSGDIGSFVKPFNLEKNLSRFLIVKERESKSLYFDIHHLIFDGTSLNIFLDSFFDLLNNDKDDFRDEGILRQISLEKNIDSQYLDDAHDFFDIMLADRNEVHDLLASVNLDEEFMGSKKQITEIEYITIFDMDENVINSFLQKKEITHNQFFASVFSYTLSRFTGSSKVLFNIIVSGRDYFDLSKSVGMFAKTMPILIDCENQSVDSFLDYSSNLINNLIKYNLYPFNILSNEYELNRDIIFQYSHNIFKNNISELRHDLQNDLTFFIYNADENKLGIKVLYSDKFSREFIKGFAETYIMILKDIMDVKELSNIDYTSKKDLELLDSYNKTEHTLNYDDIMDAFNENLAECPERKLVSYKNNSYSYGEGASIANKIAHKLKDIGVESQDSVAFLHSRCELYIFSILGILSIGGVYVPLDDNHPDKYMRFILEDTDVKVLIVNDETIKRAKEISGDLNIVNISDILRDFIETENFLPAEYGNLACILYTSGTTGNPKGVKITRKSILNISQYYMDKYALSIDDVYGLYASIGFDVATFGIFSTLFVGACVSVIPGDIRLDMAKLNKYYIEQGVTHTVMTTQVAKLFIDNIEETSLKILLTGGEMLGEYEGPEDYMLVDVYGPTESFMFTNTIPTSEKINYSSVGFLNYNVKAYILDDEGRRVPAGAVGELYLAGYQVAQGYQNREDETKKSFLDNPFDSTKEYCSLYRTGDLARFLPDGSLGIVGRIDSQVKIRGNRVELSDVENVIREMEIVKDVTVQIIKRGNNHELVAYVVPVDDLKVDNLKENIQNYISDLKPNYMIPSYVIELDEIPLNVNGKVDSRKLPEATALSKDFEAPKGYFEIAIANSFSEVLNISHSISRNDEFSSLGGDSIDLISLISMLKELDIYISVKDILDNQSVKRIAKKAKHKKSTSKISQESIEEFIETTPITSYFWNLNLKNPSLFNMSCLLESLRKIDKDLLEKSMVDIVNHHDILRAIVKNDKLFIRPQINETIFNQENKNKTNEYYFTLEYCDMSNFAEETERINRQIDIFEGPLVKLAIFEDGKKDYLYICFHHLLVDSRSIKIIINDLNLAYTQRSLNMETKLLKKTSSYQDYALSIKKYKHMDDVLEQKEYWENIVSVMKKLKHTEINSASFKRDSFPIRLPEQINTILFTNAPKYFNCTINGLFLSMIVKSWKEVMGENELSVRLNQSGRKNFDTDIVLDRTVAWLDSPYPVILKYAGNKNKEIIDNVEEILNNVPNDGFDYSILMGIETDEIPLVSFTYTNEFNHIGGGKMFNSKYHKDMTNFTVPENNFLCDIAIYGYSINNETYFKFDYNSERFSKDIMEKLGYVFLKNINNALSFINEDYDEDAHIFSNLPDKKKIFFIHSANFGSEYFYYMAQKLKDDYSFIVIEPYNRNHKENQLSSIEEYANKYIEIIKSIQPEGPYHIGGYCFGGIIAHEIAVQFKKQNEKVDSLIAFETYYIENDELKEQVLEEQILYASDFLKDGILNPKHETIEDMISYALSSLRIMYNYEPSYYDGDIIYFKAALRDESNGSDVSDRLMNHFYSKKAGGYEDFYNSEKIKVKLVPAGHDHLLNSEALKIIIPELKKFIEKED